MTLHEQAEAAVLESSFKQGMERMYLEARAEMKSQADSCCLSGSEYMAFSLRCLDMAYLKLSKEQRNGKN